MVLLVNGAAAGTLDKDEFVDGVLHIIVRDVPVEPWQPLATASSVLQHSGTLPKKTTQGDHEDDEHAAVHAESPQLSTGDVPRLGLASLCRGSEACR